jgi:hypothetical protein
VKYGISPRNVSRDYQFCEDLYRESHEVRNSVKDLLPVISEDLGRFRCNSVLLNSTSCHSVILGFVRMAAVKVILYLGTLKVFNPIYTLIKFLNLVNRALQKLILVFRQ